VWARNRGQFVGTNARSQLLAEAPHGRRAAPGGIDEHDAVRVLTVTVRNLFTGAGRA